MQIQALLVATGGRGAVGRPNTGSNVEVAKLLVFNREAEKVEGFVTACRLYLKMRMRETMVEEQIQ